MPLSTIIENNKEKQKNYENSEFRKTGSNDSYYEPPENNRPHAYAYVSNREGMAPLTVRFYSHSYDTDGWITQYSWHITGPDGFSEFTCEYNPEYTFDKPGRYRARLTVRDNQWESSIDYVYVDVYDPSKPARIEINDYFPFFLKLGSMRINFVNQKDVKIEDIEYNMTIEGGLFNALYRRETGRINVLDANENIILKTPKVWFRFGRATLKLEFNIPGYENLEETHYLFFFGPFFIAV